MKITCDSCGSKYTIADAKVSGRKVKVRCKSCKSTILVDGTTASAAGGTEIEEGLAGVSDPPPAQSPAAPRVAAAPGSTRRDAWSVNLSDDDSRDMSTAELIAGWKSGLVTTDAYAWKDGMDDWKPVLEIPELKQKLLAAKPLASDGVVSSAALPQPKAAPAADLFGSVGNAGGDIDMTHGAGALPAGAGGKKSGERNESSVLFSLDALAGGPSIPAPPGGGNVDIFGGLGAGGKLVANADLLTAPAKEPPPAPKAMAPMVMPGAIPQKKGKGGLIAAILGAAVLIAGGLAIAMSGDDAASEEALAAAKAAEEAKAAAEEQAKKNEAMAAELAKLKKAQEDAKAKADAAQKEAGKAEDQKKEEDTKKESESDSSAASSPAASSPSSGSSSPAPAAAAGPPKFNVGAAKAALAAAAANAASCSRPGGPSGVGKAQVTFSTTGRATSASVVSGPFGGTPVGSCVTSVFRRARVPAFSGSPVTVAKSFSVP